MLTTYDHESYNKKPNISRKIQVLGTIHLTTYHDHFYILICIFLSLIYKKLRKTAQKTT